MYQTPKQSAERTRNYTKKYVDRPLLTVEDRIVAAIESDICDRRSIKNDWRHIPEDVVEEILETWREIVRQELGTSTPEFSAVGAIKQIRVLTDQLEINLRNNLPTTCETPHDTDSSAS